MTLQFAFMCKISDKRIDSTLEYRTKQSIFDKLKNTVANAQNTQRQSFAYLLRIMILIYYDYDYDDYIMNQNNFLH